MVDVDGNTGVECRQRNVDGMMNRDTVKVLLFYVYMFVQRNDVIGTSPRQTEYQSNGFHGSYQYNCSRNYGCNDVCLHGPRLFWVPSCRVHLAFDIGVAAACCTRLFNGTGLRRNLFWPGAQLQCRFRDWLRLWPVLALFRIWATFWSGPRPDWRGVDAPPAPPCQPVSVLCDCLRPHLPFPTIPAPIMHSLPSCTINQIIRSEPFTDLASSIITYRASID